MDMGVEAKCLVEWRAAKHSAALHLDSQHLDVRLKPALRIPFDTIRSLQLEEAGQLVLELPDGRMVLHLGAAAAKWAQTVAGSEGRGLGVARERSGCSRQRG
jgi:hypothetical protein